MHEYSNIYNLIEELESKSVFNEKIWTRLVRKHRKDDNTIASKNFILEYIKKHKVKIKNETFAKIMMKPTRTISGVTPITIFTKPYMCSGNCIFCPNNKLAPKSYLPEEPGIQRAITHSYNPYTQVKMRIKALNSIGHNTNKIELIISGGTWDDYDINYRYWYIEEVFRALNKMPSKKYDSKKNYVEKNNLKNLHKKNETAIHKNIGMCIETRPDKVTKENIKLHRIFGITKIQLGVQTLDDEILKYNNRGHSVKETYEAINALRLAGFKIHIHWMCNLYKSNVKKDFLDFKKLFKNPNVKPDEIKIYPCSITADTILEKKFRQNQYIPYSTKELILLLSKCKSLIPNYCRINRLFRDIPSNLILGGNTATNLRQKIQEYMQEKELKCNCIRCREIRSPKGQSLKLKTTKYPTSVSTEFFLEYITKENKIAGFLRLSLYKKQNSLLINTKAMVRELHVYGTSLNFKEKSELSTQHQGLGSNLLNEAEKIVRKNNLKNIAVISAVGTRDYYKKRGYMIENRYGYALKEF